MKRVVDYRSMPRVSARDLRSPRCIARPDRGNTAAGPTTTSRCSTRRPRTDRYMAQHLWCICVRQLDRVVRSKESHAPLGALQRGQMRQETSRSTRRCERGCDAIDCGQCHAHTSNPPAPGARPRRTAADVNVQRPQRSQNERPFTFGEQRATSCSSRSPRWGCDPMFASHITVTSSAQLNRTGTCTVAVEFPQAMSHIAGILEP